MNKSFDFSLTCVFLIACVLLLGSGCATPAVYSTQPMVAYDKDTTYCVEDHEDGFTLTVSYSRYQFIPESDAVATAGKSALLSIAYELADGRKRPIEPVNEQRIRMSMGRNGFSGVTSWSGNVRVFFAKPGP